VKRGDVVVAVAPGEFGKPRPHVVVQTNQFSDHPTITVLQVTSAITAAPLFRITVDPSVGNGLRAVSQIAVDKIMTLPRGRFGRVIGELDSDTMTRVTRALAVWLAVAS
jgi:mRNA interferase MazF